MRENIDEASSMNATEPARPEVEREIPVSPEVETLLRERLLTIEQDKKTAEPWQDVKQRILKTALPR